MADFNKVILLGRITREIEVRTTRSGTSVAEIGMATNERRKGANGEWEDQTTFVDVTFFGRTAEVAGEWLGKGSPVMIEGRLKLDQWEKDGQKRSKLSVVADKMVMIGGKGEGQGGGNSGGESRSTTTAGASQGAKEFPADDDIPF